MISSLIITKLETRVLINLAKLLMRLSLYSKASERFTAQLFGITQSQQPLVFNFGSNLVTTEQLFAIMKPTVAISSELQWTIRFFWPQHLHIAQVLSPWCEYATFPLLY